MKRSIVFIVLVVLTLGSFAAVLTPHTSAEIEYGVTSDVLTDPNVLIRATSQADNDAANNLMNTLRYDDNVVNWYVVYPDAAAATSDGVSAGDLVSVIYKGTIYGNVTVFIGNVFNGAGGLDTIIANNTTIFFKPGNYSVASGSAVYIRLYKTNLSLIGLDDTPDSPSVTFDMGTDSSGRNLRNLIENETYIANITFDAKNRHMASSGSANHNYIHIGIGKSNIVFDNVTITNQPNTSLLYGNNVAINILGVDNVIFNNVTLSKWSAKTGYGPIQVTNGGKNIYFNNLKLDTVKGSQAFIKVENGSSNDDALPFTSVHFTNGLTFTNMSENEKRIYIESYIYSTFAFPAEIYRYAQLRNQNGSWTNNFIVLSSTMPASSTQYAILDLKDNTFIVKMGDPLTAQQQIQSIIDTVSFIRKVKNVTAAESYNIKYEVGAVLGQIDLPAIKASSQFQSGSKDYTGYWESVMLNIIPVENRNNDIRIREVFVFDSMGYGSKIDLPASDNRYRLFNIDFNSVENYTMHEAVEGVSSIAPADPFEYLYGNSDNLTYAEYGFAKPAAVTNASSDTFHSCIFTSLVNKIEIQSPIGVWNIGDSGSLTAALTDANNNSFTHVDIINEAANKGTANDAVPAVKWFSTDTNVAIVNIDTGFVTITGSGPVNIIAKAVDIYNNGEIEKPWAVYALTVDPVIFTITYDPNGGKGSIPDETVAFGSPYTMSSGAAFSRSGYELTGWNTSPDGTGTPFELSYNFPSYGMMHGLDLFAQWKKISAGFAFFTVTITEGPEYSAFRNGDETYFFILPAGGEGVFSVIPKDGWSVTLSLQGSAILSNVGGNDYKISKIGSDVMINVTVKKTITGSEEGGDGDVDKGKGEGEWAVANLILALATIIGGVLVAIITRERTLDGLGEKRSKRSWSMRGVAVITGLIAVIVFLMTENWTLPMALFDKWTIYMIFLFIVCVISAGISFRYDDKEPEDQENP